MDKPNATILEIHAEMKKLKSALKEIQEMEDKIFTQLSEVSSKIEEYEKYEAEQKLIVAIQTECELIRQRDQVWNDESKNLRKMDELRSKIDEITNGPDATLLIH